MLWLWMKTAWNLTFEQSQNNGNYQIGVIGTLGSKALRNMMTTMELELPMLTFADKIADNFTQSKTTCEDFYMTNLGLYDNQTVALCL